MIGCPDVVAFAANAKLLNSKNAVGMAIRIFRGFVLRKISEYTENGCEMS